MGKVVRIPSRSPRSRRAAGVADDLLDAAAPGDFVGTPAGAPQLVYAGIYVRATRRINRAASSGATRSVLSTMS
jgi:hypothetical protein